MTIAYWCVLAVAVITYAFGAAAKSGGGLDNHQPRVYMEGVQGWRRRAWWAHLNGLEAFPTFAAAVIIAHLAGAPQARIDLLAVAFVLLRIVYGLLYVSDRATLRSAVWGLGFLCVIGLFVIAA